MFKDEKWKPVLSYPGIEASSHGRVRRADFMRKAPKGGEWLCVPLPTFGYEEKMATGRQGVPKRRIIRFSYLKKTLKVHRLVCEAFHGPRPFDGAVCIHIDENPSNNRPENLKWGTQQENLMMPEVVEWRSKRRHPRLVHMERMAATADTNQTKAA